MILDGHQEGEQRPLVNLEGLTQPALLEYLEGGGGQHAGVADGAASGEHVQPPGVNINLVLHHIVIIQKINIASLRDVLKLFRFSGYLCIVN